MESKGLARNILEHMLSGLIVAAVTFYASSLYTDYRIQAKRNVTLVPMLIDYYDTCDVDNEKLETMISSFSEPKEKFPSQVTLYSYLKTVQDNDYKVLMKETIPENILPKLTTNQIIECGKDRENSQNIVFILQAAMLFDSPTSYILMHECSMIYEGTEIPILLSLKKVPAEQIGIQVKPVATLVKEDSTLFFGYNGKPQSQIDQQKFRKLVKEMYESHEVQGRVECHVIGSDKREKIGDDKKLYIISTRPGSLKAEQSL